MFVCLVSLLWVPGGHACMSVHHSIFARLLRCGSLPSFHENAGEWGVKEEQEPFCMRRGTGRGVQGWVGQGSPAQILHVPSQRKIYPPPAPKMQFNHANVTLQASTKTIQILPLGRQAKTCLERSPHCFDYQYLCGLR